MSDYQQRFARHGAELRAIYLELYHDEHAFDYFCSMLERMYGQRSKALRALDAEREKNPHWYKDQKMLGMQLYTQCFGGTLNGVRAHLDYLRETGVNYLHLMPLLESPEGKSDGGYAVSDFRRVQPDLGTMEDLAALTAECHEMGMAVCVDFVMNHTSDEHDWARRAKAGEAEYQQRYFFFDNWDVPNQFEQTVPQVFPTTAPGSFTWCPEAGKVVMTSFYPFQWDLNYGNPTVLNDMTENMLFLCNQGIDVIRLDAVPYIWKQLGTSCRNLPQVHTIVRMIRMICEIVCPSVLLLGEVVMEPARVAPYFGTPDKPECHMLYNVTTMCTTWHTVATADTALLRRQLDILAGLPQNCIFQNYLRCHDDIGWGLDYDFLARFGMQEVPHKKYLNDFFTGKTANSFAIGELYNDDPRLGDARLCGTTASLCGIERAGFAGDMAAQEKAVRLDLTLHAFMLSQSGLPVLYSGDEIGQLNDYSYKDDPEKASDSRYIHRGAFPWALAANRSLPGTLQNELFPALRRIEEARRSHSVFDAGVPFHTIDTQNQAVLGLVRENEGEKFIGLYNFCGERCTACTGETGLYTDLVTGEAVDAGNVPLEPFGFRWLWKETPAHP